MGITEWSMMNKPSIDHVGIATKSIEEAYRRIKQHVFLTPIITNETINEEI